MKFTEPHAAFLHCPICGARRPKFLNMCRTCTKAELDAHFAEQRRIVATNTCPTCGAGLKRNSSMRGWWQCEQFGAERFRKDPSQPSCNFQTFTE